MNKPAFDPSKPFTSLDSKPPYQPDAPADSSGVDYGQVVKDALNEAQMGNGSKMRALLTDPVTQAKALPYLAGTAMALAPIPFGATAGTVGGRQLSNAALRTYGKPEEIPSNTQQMIEGGTALAGDVLAVPSLTKKIYGSQVGEAESAAGVPQFPESLRRPGGAATTTKWIDQTLPSVLKGEVSDPTALKQINDQIDFIYKNRKNFPLTNVDSAKLALLNKATQGGLNQIPGRADAAANLARSQIVPNTLSNLSRNTPTWAKLAASAVGGDALVRALGSIGSR